MFDNRQKQDAGISLQPSTTATGTASENEMLGRRPRHSGIFEAAHALDTALDQGERETLARWIADQYKIEYGSVLLGMVAVCYLGPPFVDHRLDLIGGIVDHFAASDPMPAPYENARMLARSGSYAFVEVHSDGNLVCITDDGAPH